MQRGIRISTFLPFKVNALRLPTKLYNLKPNYNKILPPANTNIFTLGCLWLDTEQLTTSTNFCNELITEGQVKRIYRQGNVFFNLFFPFNSR